jgi:hypothetical protein
VTLSPGTSRPRATAVDVAPDVKEVEDCVRRHLPRNSSVQTISMKRVA